MRVIAGSARGTRLRAPKGRITRPMQDRVKEDLFNRLGVLVAGARVLDLFSGSGALGIEALSRGAAHATFVEHAPIVLATLRRNLERTHLTGQARVLPLSVPVALRRLARAGEVFDLIIADPPYRKGWDDWLLRSAICPVLLRSGGVLVLEHETRSLATGSWRLWKSAKYDGTEVCLFVRPEAASSGVPDQGGRAAEATGQGDLSADVDHERADADPFGGGRP